MHTRTGNTLIAAFALSLLAAGGSAMAHGQDKDSKWETNHPRREQVNERLARQHKRISQEAREGELSKSQAHALRQDDRKIRQEERDMAAQNGGHITVAEQKVLNQQENQVSKKIGK